MSDRATEKAEAFLDRYKAEVDKWENKDTKQQRVSVAYWFGLGKQTFRIFKIADTLVEVVELCRHEESRLSQTAKG